MVILGTPIPGTGSGRDRYRALFVGRTRYRLPLDEHLARKWDALAQRLELQVLASGSGSDGRFKLVAPRRFDGVRFYAGLPLRVMRSLRSFHPDVVIAESPYEAVAVQLARKATRSPSKLIVEVHGDWQTSTRLYGSRTRSLISPIADRLAGWAIAGADGHRAISQYTAELLRDRGYEPNGVFPTYSDLRAFAGAATPLPWEPRVLFVGVLERYKNVDGLASAWETVRSSIPGAELRLVGDGREQGIAEALQARGATWERRLSPPGVASALDLSRLLVLPSHGEGYGRVIVEAFLRGRPVVATRVGGIPELVEHDVSGLLVEPGDTQALARAIMEVLCNDEIAERLAAGAKAAGERLLVDADEFAGRVWDIVDVTMNGRVVAPRVLEAAQRI
jgi:glycogen synthase